MARDRVKEEKDFQELTSSDSNTSCSRVKEEISKIIKTEIKITAKNDSQKNLINSIKNNEITICGGKAGSGKTYLAVAYALNLLRKKENNYKKIYLIKSVNTLKSEDLGYLKGSLDDKITPFMLSYYINMEKVIGSVALKSLIEKEIVKPLPLAFMRGVSLDNCLIISDETQNISMDNSHTLMTRIGENCKLIMLGDTNQIDITNKSDSSLKHLIKMFTDTENFGIVEMNNSDINVRNPLIDVIEAKYNEYFNKNIKVNKQLLVESKNGN